MSVELELLEAVVPEAKDALKVRYEILKCIMLRQPIGRRSLAAECGTTERKVRAEIDVLNETQLVNISSDGVTLSQKGQAVLKKLDFVMQAVYGITIAEEKLAKALGISRVVITKGDIDSDVMAFKTLGKFAARFVSQSICDGDIIAITGGRTLRCVVDSVEPRSVHKNVMVIPGRGGIGSDIEIQSNTIAAVLADKLNASADTLYLPDMLAPELAKSIMSEPNIKKLMETLKNVNMLVYGIGDAFEMAKRRGLPSIKIDLIKRKDAVGEAFGYYFNQEGEIVYSSHTIGMTIDEMRRIDRVIGVAGGSCKAKAILAVVRNIKNGVLITDEGAAGAMFKELKIN